MKKDYATATDYFSRVIDVNEKTFGENSTEVAKGLLSLSMVPYAQDQYDKAEPYLLRSVHITESLVGNDGIDLNASLSSLCNLYPKWDKPDKLETCDRRLLAVLEKQFGPDSPVLVSTLTSDAQALRRLGRSADAAKVEKRSKSIQASMGQELSDGNVLPPSLK